MKRLLGVAAMVAALGAGTIPVAVAQGPDADRDLAVTVYNENLGLVKDRRRFSLPNGVSELRFTGVASTIDPTSAHLRALGGAGLDVLSMDYRFDLVNTDKLLERYVDRPVEVAGKDDQIRKGTLLAHDPVSLVLREGSGAIVVLNRAEVREIRLPPESPDGLVSKPTLVWRVRSQGGGAQPVEVSYTASALSWHADYVAVLEDEGSRLDLQGWASIENRSGVDYENAKLQLVAGTIHRVREIRPPVPMRMEMDVAAQKTLQLEERPFYEYHVYELPMRATLANNQVKQLGLLEAAGIRSSRKYTYEPQRDERRVWTTVEFGNAGQGLGVPLPEGVVRVFQRDRDGSLTLIGEDRIRHTARNDTARVAVGAAFDIVAERRQTDARQVTPRVQEAAFEITLTNQKSAAVQVTVVEHAYGDWEILESSVPARKRDATTFEFVVRCPPGRPVTLTYRLRIRT